MAQEVELLPSKGKALSSNSYTVKNKTKQKNPKPNHHHQQKYIGHVQAFIFGYYSLINTV
jgi:hypothetical protein